MANEAVKQEILNTIKQYDKIVISRHKIPDGDAIGSSVGLMKILADSFPEKKICLANEDHSEFFSFLGDSEALPDDSFYEGALLLVTDTGTQNRISNAKIALAEKIIKIDHHIEDKPYGDLCWIEEHRSSCCEMIVDFVLSFPEELHLSKEAASALYVGMVTDSGRFRYRETSGETLRNAAFLLDQGIDSDTLYARIYLEEFEFLKYQAHIFKKMQISRNGVASLFVSRRMQEKFHLSFETASNSISFLSGIKGSLVWIAFIEQEDHSYRVRLRSRFLEIQPLAAKHGGGGHANASGISRITKKEAKQILSEADELVRAYKENHKDWL